MNSLLRVLVSGVVIGLSGIVTYGGYKIVTRDAKTKVVLHSSDYLVLKHPAATIVVDLSTLEQEGSQRIANSVFIFNLENDAKQIYYRLAVYDCEDRVIFEKIDAEAKQRTMFLGSTEELDEVCKQPIKLPDLLVDEKV